MKLMLNHPAIVGFALLISVASVRQTVIGQGATATKQGSGAGQFAIEAGLVMRAGNVRPVARTEFRLVRKSVAALLLQNDPEGLSHHAGSSRLVAAGRLSKEDAEKLDADMEMNSYCTVLRGHGNIFANKPGRLEALLAAMPVIKTNTVQTVQTDFAGKALFRNVPGGNYWLSGCYSVAPNESAWNVPIRVVAGVTKSIILDQDNAVTN